MERALRGYLLINAKKHFVYEGLNIIGRYKEATVIIPDTSVSHNHSAIVIIENRHYLSDATSTNGTCLGENKLVPLRLYEVDTGSIIKFGLIEATYLKLTDTPDLTLENEDDKPMQFEESILCLETQPCDDPGAINLPDKIEPKTFNKSDSPKLVTVSIHDMSTQIMGDQSDDELELVTYSTNEGENLDKCNIQQSPNTSLLINDMPTQILCPIEDSDDDELGLLADRLENADNFNNSSETRNSIENVLPHNLPTQLVNVTEDIPDASLLEVSNIHETSTNIIEETVIANDGIEDDTNSLESTDFLTMQPASTQCFISESQSPLCVQQLQRRVRNIISSSDEECCNPEETKGKTFSPNNCLSSDDDTDIEVSPSKKKMGRKNKPVINSDSDEDSTDVEMEGDTVVTRTLQSTIRNDKEDNSDTNSTNLSIPCQDNANTCNKERKDLDDSDIIPTTQDTKVSSDVSKQNEVTNKHHSEKNYSENADHEQSLADSFRLVLTNTPTSNLSQLEMDSKPDVIQDGLKKTCDTEIIKDAAANKTDTGGGDDKKTSSSPSSNNQTNLYTDKDKEAHETQPTQLEVSFDNNALPMGNNDDRPTNPLVNILESVGSSDKNESVEDRLAKMFESQVIDYTKSKDDIFAQPTQMLAAGPVVSKGDDVFLAPTQKIVTKDDVFAQPTQIITSIETVTSKNDDVFLIPTQKITGKDDVFAQPTQIITSIEAARSKDDDVFLMATQKVITEVLPDIDSKNKVAKRVAFNLGSNTVIDGSKKNQPPSKENLTEDDDIFLQPTQIVTSTPSGSDTTCQQKLGSKGTDEDKILQSSTLDFGDAYSSFCDYYSNAVIKSSVNKNLENDLYPPVEVANPNTTMGAAIKVPTLIIGDVFLQPTQIISNESSISDPKQSEIPKNINLADKIIKQTDVVESAHQNKDHQLDDDDLEATLQKKKLSKAKKPALQLENNDEGEGNVETNKKSTLIKGKDFINKHEDVESVNDDNNLSLDIGTRTRRKIFKMNEMKQENTTTKRQKALEIDSVNIEVECKEITKQSTRKCAINIDQTSNEVESKRTVKRNTRKSPIDIDETSSAVESKEIPKRNTRKAPINIDETSNEVESKITVKRNTRKSPIDIDETSSEVESKEIPRRNTRKTPINVDETSNNDTISNKSVQFENDDKPSTSTEGGSSHSITIRVSKRLKKKTSNKDFVYSDNSNDTDTQEFTEKETTSKNKRPSDLIKAEISVEKTPTPSTNANLTDENLKATLIRTQASPGNGRKSKHQEENEKIDTVKRAKIDNNTKNETSIKETACNTSTDDTKPVRRSKRNQSTDEKFETDVIKRRVIKETSILRKLSDASSSRTSVDSGDEFVDTKRVTPVRTSKRTKQSTLNKNQTDNEIATTTLIPANIAKTRLKKLQGAEEYIKSKSDESDNRASIVEKSPLPSTSKINIDKKIRKRSETDLNNTEDALCTTPINADATVRVNKSKKLKIEKKEAAEQHGNESESNCSSSNAGTESQTRNSRQRRSLSRTSENDFKENKMRKERTPSITVPATPERTKRILKPKVVFTMLDSPQLETIIRSLGGLVVDSIEASTVLVTSCVKRSQKLLSAVGLSKPICSPNWLQDSKKANKFLDPWDYILEDEEAETKWNFSLRQSLRRSANTKLFENYTFQLMVNTAQDVLKGSIESCGGKCISRAPSKDNQSNFVIVASPDNKSKYARFLKQIPPPKIVAAEAIFDGVLRQELHFEQHLLK